MKPSSRVVRRRPKPAPRPMRRLSSQKSAVRGRNKASTPAPFLKGYIKTDRLGAGGFGVVWSATDTAGISVAVKQAPKRGEGGGKAAVAAAWQEVRCSGLLARLDDEEQRRAQVVRLPTDDVAGSGHGSGAGAGAGAGSGARPTRRVGRKASGTAQEHFMRLIEYVETPTDVWLVFEKGGESLSSLLFDVQGESYKGSRVYHVRQRSLFDTFVSHPNSLKKLVRTLIEGVVALNKVGIVHADIKPDNILLKYRSGAKDVRSVKLIDLGSSYTHDSPARAATTTPEYLPPEMVALTTTAVSKEAVCMALRDSSLPYATDMWSVGAVLLEILCGFPLWMSYKSRVEKNGRDVLLSGGLFAVPQREAAKIVARQVTVVKNLEGAINRFPGPGLHRTHPEVLDLLQRLLQIDPLKRISPGDALRHPFLAT